ncbi:MAG: protein TolQ [Alphaproteobacteria bacterium]|nr:protein TolQ [Alphaproteobacteria bacterium]
MEQTVSMSIWGMFQHSDMFMKLLIIALLLASVWSWAIIIEKWRVFKRIKARSANFERQFWSGGSLDTLFNELKDKPTDPLSAIFVSAMKEWKRSMRLRKDGNFKGVNLQERIEKVMQIAIEREIENLNNRLIFLASTGSVAPLTGLFGTVWGIMSSFQAIGVTKNTNISAVAPGVAEALLTTAVGLIAAIPAVVAYNKFANDIDRYTNKMETFAGELEAIISRQIETVSGKE